MSGVRTGFLCPRKSASVIVGLWFALAAAAAGAAPRVVAIGDVHGNLPAFQAILAQAGLVDAGGAWTGGDAVLVQLGDLIDRGPSMRATLDFVMALEGRAASRGGRVVALLGNHEVMNMTGDLRYVAPENYTEFADAGSEKRRTDAWEAVVALRKSRARRLGQPDPPIGPEARRDWLAAHPPGYLEQREAFGPDGAYGRWLRRHSACVLESGSAFLHGGVSPSLAEPLENLDRRVHEDLAAYDADRKLFVEQGLILPFFDLEETFRALREELAALDASGTAESGERRKIYQRFLEWDKWTMNSPEGPLWFRGYNAWTDEEVRAQMPRLLAAVHAERFVVAHSVQPDGRIRMRFDGAVFLIDTGMLDARFFPGGRASALELSDGVARAIYPGEPPRILQEAPAKKVAGLR